MDLNFFYVHNRLLPEKFLNKIEKSAEVCSVPLKDLVINYIDRLILTKSVSEAIKTLLQKNDKLELTLVGSAGFDGASG